VIYAQQKLGISERRACQALGQSRGLQRRCPVRADDEAALTEDIVRLATKYGRYGYKRITALLRVQGWLVNHKRVERIWRQEGVKVPQRHKKRGRLYLNDGSCLRLRACWPNHVWSYDFVADRLIDGTKIRTLTVIDEYTRECLALRTGYKLKSDDVMDVLTDPPPINESGSGVILDRFWTSFMEERNGEEAIHGRADHRAFAAC